MTRRISRNGVKFIQKHEGFRTDVYLDQAGLPTEGTGHLLTAEEKVKYRVGDRVPDDVLEMWFDQDISRFESAVNRLVKVPLTQNEFDALTSFAFNVGVSAFQNSSVLRRLNGHNNAGAADAFLLWNKVTKNGKKVVSKGLTNRRKAEKELFQSSPNKGQDESTAVPTTTPQASEPNANEPTETLEQTPLAATPTGNTVESTGLPPIPVSKGSIVTAVGVGFVGLVTWLRSFISENIVVFVAGVALIGLAAFYWHYAKQRQKEKQLAVLGSNGAGSDGVQV